MSSKVEILKDVIESLNVEQKEIYRNINSVLNNSENITYVISELKSQIRTASLIDSDLQIAQSLIAQAMEHSIKESDKESKDKKK